MTDHADEHPEEFVHIPLTLPPDMDLRIGYEGENRYVGYWYEVRTDGYDTWGGAAANWRSFDVWNQEAGMQLLRVSHEATAEEGEEFEPPAYNPSLTYLLEQQLDANIGSDDMRATHGLLFDFADQQVYLGTIDHIREFCHRFNDPPEWFDDVPDDPNVLWRLFQQAVGELDGDELFRDSSE